MKKILVSVVFLLIAFAFVYAGNQVALTRDENGQVTQGVLSILRTQRVTTGAASAATTNAFTSGIVRVACSEDAHLTFAANPTATTSHAFIPDNSVEYFSGVVGLKGAVIQASTAGFCTFTEMQ